MDLELIRNYIRFKASAERHIGHPWHDDEMKKIVEAELTKLNVIPKLLSQAVDRGMISCPECQSEFFATTRSCNKCGWLNPLVSLNLL